MAQIGYTLMGEQCPPRQLIDDAVRAERAGFDFAVCSDHYYPWLEEQGHSSYAWAVLGALAHATERMGLMSFVTCPIQRYHPVVVAQKAATVALLSEGRFTLGLGSGENLNEHVAGGWPHRAERLGRFAEALEIIRALLEGDRLAYSGHYYEIPEAYLWDRPADGVPIGVAVSGPESCGLAGAFGDVMVATEPRPELVLAFEAAGGVGKPKYGQVAMCYGPDEERCVKLAHEQFRWAGLGWPVNAELPDPRAFQAASASVTEDEVARQVSCGPDTKKHVDAITRYFDAGFTHVAVVQIGGHTQRDFLDFAERELLPALR